MGSASVLPVVCHERRPQLVGVQVTCTERMRVSQLTQLVRARRYSFCPLTHTCCHQSTLWSRNLHRRPICWLHSLPKHKPNATACSPTVVFNLRSPTIGYTCYVALMLPSCCNCPFICNAMFAQLQLAASSFGLVPLDVSAVPVGRSEGISKSYRKLESSSGGRRMTCFYVRMVV